jgi:hypothetical protein
VELVARALLTPCRPFRRHGVSDNAASGGTTQGIAPGFHDSSRKFASMFPAAPGASDDPTLRFQGGRGLCRRIEE